MRSKEDVISIIRSYCLANAGDEATTDLLLAVGAEILGVSAEEMQKMLAWSDLEPDVPDQEGGHEQDRVTKRLSDGQAVMDCQKCEADWTAKHGKPLVQCTALYCRNTLDMDTGYAYDLRYEARDGFTVGIPVQYDFRDWFGLRADLVFVQKGQKMHRTDTYNAIHTDTRNNYLQLPVMASFSFGGERLRGFLNAGGYVGGWLSSHRKGVTHRFFSVVNGEENGVVVPGNRYEFV